MWKFFLHKIKQSLPTDRATRIRSSFAAIYAFTAWNMAIITFYYSIQDQIPNTAEKKEKFMKKMKDANIDVEFLEIKGFSITTSENKENETNTVAT